MLKKISCLALAVIMIAGIATVGYAEENSANAVTTYQETYLYIDFRNIDIDETETGWSITLKESLSESEMVVVCNE